MRVFLQLAPVLLAARVLSAQNTSSLPDDPRQRLPECSSTSLKSDWQLSGKQRTCHWITNGVLSVEGLVGSNVIALTSVVMDLEEERGDPYRARFGQRFAENALKTTGAYAGTLLTGEDPRRRPPYLVLKGPRPSGFFPRTGLALKENLLAYRCDAPCTRAEHVRTGLSAGRILGSAASGFGRELTLHSSQRSVSRAARASLSAYAIGYASAVVGEFTPELTAGVKKSIGSLFRRR
jgi:hypothetical protein